MNASSLTAKQLSPSERASHSRREDMSSSNLSLTSIQRALTQYGMLTYCTLGNIGLLLNLIIFSQTRRRRNSFTLYTLATSLSSLISLNSAIIPLLYSLHYRNPATSSILACRLFYYLRHAFSQMMRTFLVLACIDRYATCSGHTRFRRVFNQYRTTLCIILGVVLFWLVFSIFPSSLQTIQNNSCDVFDYAQSITFSIYVILVVCLLPLIGIIVFGSLIMINLRRIRARVQPVSSVTITPLVNILRKRDRDMIRMSLVEIIFYIFTAVPLTIFLLYRIATLTVTKSKERLDIEIFLAYLARSFLLYLNNSLSFWVYLSSSRSFRREVKHLLGRFCELLCKLRRYVEP